MKLFDMLKEKRILLVAHRGVCGGNVPCNSLEAFQIALNQGVDVVELDVDKSKDGVLFIQHPGMESVHLGLNESIKNYDSHDIKKMYLLNQDLTPSQYTIPTLKEALLLLKDKCIVNIDKFWENPEAISQLVHELHMEDQVIIKTEPREDFLDDIEKYASDLPYMTIIREQDDITEKIKNRNINYIGAEVLFTREDDEVASEAYIEKMHTMGYIVWANAIVYNHLDVLSACHNDDISLIEDPQKGWGWLASRGFDLIQTDFLLPCRLYLESIGKRSK